jgi:hypothetical protein
VSLLEISRANIKSKDLTPKPDLSVGADAVRDRNDVLRLARGRWFTILQAKPTSMVCRETFHLRSRTSTAICRTHPRNPPIKLPFATIQYIGSVIGAVATGVLTKLRPGEFKLDTTCWHGEEFVDSQPGDRVTSSLPLESCLETLASSRRGSELSNRCDLRVIRRRIESNFFRLEFHWTPLD